MEFLVFIYVNYLKRYEKWLSEKRSRAIIIIVIINIFEINIVLFNRFIPEHVLGPILYILFFLTAIFLPFIWKTMKSIGK